MRVWKAQSANTQTKDAHICLLLQLELEYCATGFGGEQQDKSSF